jgi:molybdopterin/thiamine biosynthesis adenylyltransferase
VNYTSDFNKRNKGIVDESVLQEATITIIGLGSGGAGITNELVRCGVTNFKLNDFDTISLSNLCRSEYNLLDVGKKKTKVMREKLQKINPCINVELYDESIMDMDIEKLEKIIDSSDLIIEATDSPQTKILINGLAYNKKPVIYPAVYEHGRGGDILLTMPGLPCYECVFKSIIDDIPTSKKRDWDYSTGQAKPMPALISDIQIVISRTVKIALAILTAGTQDSFFEKITEPGCTLLRINNERNDLVPNKTFYEEWVETKIHHDCMCQTLK